jgi:S-ribosylhomocysteine lyase
VSRKDRAGSELVTTFDLRFKEPNKEPVIDNPALHTIEHLGATFLRSHKDWGPKTVYFGPMGCRTGFYVIFSGDLDSRDILPVLGEMLDWIEAFSGPIPGARPAECGNWSEQNLDMAKWECRRWGAVVRSPADENLNYPG